MKPSEFKTLITKHITTITHLETCERDLIEGECTLWERDDCTILIENINQNSSFSAIADYLPRITAQWSYLNAHRDDVVNWLKNWVQPDDSVDLNDIFVVYIGFVIDTDNALSCCFALSAPSWGERVAECTLEEDLSLIFDEWSTI